MPHLVVLHLLTFSDQILGMEMTTGQVELLKLHLHNLHMVLNNKHMGKHHKLLLFSPNSHRL